MGPEVDAIVRAVAALEPVPLGFEDWPVCPFECREMTPQDTGHADNCPIALARRLLAK